MLRRVACDCWKAPGSSSSSYHSTSTRRPNSCKTTAAAAIVSCSSERARGAKQRAPHLVNSTAPAIASPAGTVTAAVLPAGYTVESGWCCSRGGAAAVGAGTCDSACRTALGSQLEGATAQCCCRRCPSPDGFVARCRGLQSINMGALQHSTAQHREAGAWPFYRRSSTQQQHLLQQVPRPFPAAVFLALIVSRNCGSLTPPTWTVLEVQAAGRYTLAKSWIKVGALWRKMLS